MADIGLLQSDVQITGNSPRMFVACSNDDDDIGFQCLTVTEMPLATLKGRNSWTDAVF
jgi:hypothetical protein